MWNFMPFGLLAGHSSTLTEICAVLATIAICGVVALVVTLVQAARGDSLLAAAISFAVTVVFGMAAWIIWALALSSALTAHGQLAFQHAFVLLVCRHLILALALAVFIWFLALLCDLATTDYKSDLYARRSSDVLVAILWLVVTGGLVIGALAFPY